MNPANLRTPGALALGVCQAQENKKTGRKAGLGLQGVTKTCVQSYARIAMAGQS